mmetsp:Transcript_52777/g.94891  ORF Transcript_52777/g.94891 Transcript_52777/m.94891 type:complete len:1172 (-) Transcript_52777:100-3615(-)
MASNIAQNPGKDGMTPVQPTVSPLQDRAAQLQKCKILGKLKAGDLHSITKENVEELFEVLDQNERGELSHHDLKMLQDVRELNLTDDDIMNLIKDCDKDESGKISMDELYKAFTQGSIVHKHVLAFLGQGPKTHKVNECDRETLLNYLREEHETKDALWSLPPTLIFFISFFYIVTWHLDMTTAYSMQSAIQGEVEGEGKPYLGTYVHDVPTFWEWMRTSFVSAQFKSRDELLGDWPQPGRFASFNQIVGGMQVIKYMSDPEVCPDSTPLRTAYDTWYGPGRCYKGEATSDTSIYFLYHEQADDMIAHINQLANDIWVSHNTTMLDFTNLYYNGHLGAFTMFHLTFEFLPSGVVRFLFDMETFQADPYKDMTVLIFDIIFGIFIIRMFYTEIKEFVPRMLNGLDGVLQYFEFWNVIDDLAIFMGIACMTLWAMVCVEVGGNLQDKIAALPTTQLDKWVLGNQTYFTPDQLENEFPHDRYYNLINEVHEAGASVASLHVALRWVVFFYSLVLMMKFFKGFRANPRLDIVVQTMITSSTDLAHFGIVFGIIFVVFSVMAYVAFGAKIKQFSEQNRSLYMCWRILLGDFDVDEMDMVSLTLSNLWFFLFQLVVMLILLNMLLAIIMDTYTNVKSEKEDPVEIWNQTKIAVTHLRERRGHLPLLYMICEMEDDDQPAHPTLHVTPKSLKKAFERDKMTRHNAEYLIKHAVEWAREMENRCELSLSDAVRLIGIIRTTVMKVTDTSEKTYDLLKAQVNLPQTMRHDMILAGIEPDEKVKGKPRGMQAPNGYGAPPGNSVMGVPVNGYANNPNAMHPNGVGMHPNQAQAMNGHMPAGPLPVVAAHVVPNQPQMRNDQMLALDNRPFDPDMSFHNAHLARTAENPGGNRGLGGTSGNNMAQSPGTAGQLNNTFASTTMSSVSAGPQYSNSYAGGFPSSPGGMGMDPGMEYSIVKQLQMMQASIDNLQDAVMDQRAYIENRDHWLEQKVTNLDNRCKKVEALSDRLYQLLHELDVGDLASVPRKVVHALNTHGGAGNSALQAQARRWPTNGDEGDAAPAAIEDGSGTPRSGSSPGGETKLDKEIRDISKGVKELLAHAEESTELKKLLWKVDLNVRQMRGGPAAGTMDQTAMLRSVVLEAIQQSGLTRNAANSESGSRRPSRMPRGSRISVAAPNFPPN